MKEEPTLPNLCKCCQWPLEYRFIDILLPHHEGQTSNYLGAGIESQYLLPTFVCSHCFLVQTDEAYLAAPEQIFTSPFGSSRLNDVKDYTEKVFEQFNITDHHFDVTLMKRKSGLPYDPDFNFGTGGLYSLMDMYGQADSIHCHDELAYANNVNDFMKALKLFLKPSGVITMKFLHLLPIFEGHALPVTHSNRFPFLSFTTVDKMLKKYGLVIFDVDYYPASEWLGIAVKQDDNGTRTISKAVTALRGKERDMGMSSLRCYAAIKDKVRMMQDMHGSEWTEAEMYR